MDKQQDFSKKIVIVIDKTLEQWQVLNAVAHISAYIGHKLEEEFDTGDYFVTQDEIKHPRNSQYPIILLRAKPTQLPNLMTKVRESGLLYHGFFKEMIETSDDSEIITALSNKLDINIEYLGIGIFGSIEQVNTLTKNFQVWR
jgi:hypothetical protein